jgi:hypothetical protein
VAVGLIEAAIAADSVNGATANQLNAVCWEAAIAGLADHVLGICEQAVVMAPDSTYIIDSRGLALALTGNRSGAIRDFQAFMKDADSTDRLRREDWIRRLQSDGLTLEAIRQSLGRPLGRP